MATAYAAVVSLTHVMDHIKLYHARQPIFLDGQLMQLQSLNQLLTFLQDFLEVYSHGRSSKEMEALECRIANAAHAAEDVIESHIVDDIHARSNGHEKRSAADHFSQALRKVIPGMVDLIKERNFSKSLRKVIESMDLIKMEVMKTKDNRTSKNQLPRDPASASLSSTPPSKKDTVVVYDQDLNNILNKLVDQQSSRQVIPIIGMGGIGKTTLAKIAYEHLFVVSHFHVRGWVTISQQYDVREILLCLLSCMHVGIGQSNQESYELGTKLHQHLFGRRYLIILDDMWSTDAWDELKSFLPDNNDGSRIVVTSRILKVANNFASSNLYQMNLLDENKSWRLLCRKVFVEKDCPPEFVDVGKRIAKNCKGLPLSIGAVGGLLAKSNMVQEYWEYVAENTNMSMSSNNEENCLKILSLSYTHLPIHLKPCFLYLGVFREDYVIRASMLIKLWVAEGFLKPDRAKSLVDVGRDYLKDLIERNLLSAELGCTGNVKYCKIHDLLRDMCLAEARKQIFFNIKVVKKKIVKLNNTDILNDSSSVRRMAIHLKADKRYTPQGLVLRSLICDFPLKIKVPGKFRLLRVFQVYNYKASKDIFQLVNSRYLNFCLKAMVLPSSISMLWNLQTINLSYTGRPSSPIVAPVEIWMIPQLMHVIVSELCLPDLPPVSQVDQQGDVIVLENLQTLSLVVDFRCTEEVLRKIPNLVKLKLRYRDHWHEGLAQYSLNNFRRLQKLQSLFCEFPLYERDNLRLVQGFSGSLKKLTLRDVSFSWEDITTKIGPLPHLEKLKLVVFRPEEDYWNPVEGHFLHLKYLELYSNSNLLCWTGDSVHFPVLEHLVVHYVTNLKEIPSGIGDIATLQLIELRGCSDSVNDSAKEILKEQQSYGNDSIRLLVNEKPVIIEDNMDEPSE